MQAMLRHQVDRAAEELPSQPGWAGYRGRAVVPRSGNRERENFHRSALAPPAAGLDICRDLNDLLGQGEALNERGTLYPVKWRHRGPHSSGGGSCRCGTPWWLSIICDELDFQDRRWRRQLALTGQFKRVRHEQLRCLQDKGGRQRKLGPEKPCRPALPPRTSRRGAAALVPGDGVLLQSASGG